jgi:hypothetical protein
MFGISLKMDISSSSSSSSDKRRVSDQSRSFDISSSVSLVSDTKKSLSTDHYDSSFSSPPISKSSRESEGYLSHAIHNMGILGEFEEPPTDIFQGSKGSNDVSGSLLSMPSLADFTAEKSSIHHSVASMPSLGEIDEEELQGNSVSSFVTGASSSDSFLPKPRTGSKSIFKILEEDAAVAGTTLEGLGPASQQIKPRLERWSSDEVVKPRVEEAIRIVEDQSPKVGRRRVSETMKPVDLSGKLEGSSEIASSLDRPPRVVKRQMSRNGRHTMGMAPMAVRLADPLTIAALENTDMPPVVARRHESVDFLEDE